jgi:hypothetical protein
MHQGRNVVDSIELQSSRMKQFRELSRVAFASRQQHQHIDIDERRRAWVSVLWNDPFDENNAAIRP